MAFGYTHKHTHTCTKLSSTRMFIPIVVDDKNQENAVDQKLMNNALCGI